MSDIIKMNYEQMDEMSKIFKQAAQQMDELKGEMNNVAGTLEGGALLGKGGEAFVNIIRSNLLKSIGNLEQKFNELSQDILGAMMALRDKDGEAQSRFK